MHPLKKMNYRKTHALLSGALISLFAAQIISAQEPADLLPRDPMMENPADAYANDILGQADRMIQAKDQNGALMILNDSFNRFTCLRSMMFGKMLDAYLEQGNVNDAREFYLQHAKQDKELARAGLSQVYSYYVNKKDAPGVLEWTKQLTEFSLPDDAASQAFTWRLKAVCSDAIPAEARVVIKDCAGRFNSETCRAIILQTLTPLIESGKYDDAGRLLDLIEKEGKNHKELLSLAALSRAKILFLKNQWTDGESFTLKKASELSETDMAELIGFAASKARNNEEYAIVDHMCMSILKKQKGAGQAGNQAAAVSLRMLKAGDKAGEVPGRLEQLMAFGIAPNTLFGLYCENFYFVVLKENNDLTDKMLAFDAKLTDQTDSTEDKKQLALLLIDGYFVKGDYNQALQMVDANQKYWDKEWLDSTTVKMRAHLALKNKNYREAVENFRKYMDYVVKEDRSSLNPETGQIYTSEMLLGFNALRIGNILRENLKDEEAAKQAYDEAEQYFKKAISEVKPHSRESKYIEEQMAQIEAQKKK